MIVPVPGDMSDRSPATDSAPSAEAFAAWPASWYVFGTLHDLDHGPISKSLFDRQLVGYRTTAGQAVVLDGRCWHLGADLSGGSIIGNCLKCPFHGWQFDESGACVHIPAQSAIPSDARQERFETAQRAGLLWVFPARQALFPLPFFDGVQPDELIGAPPFEFRLNCPWWLVGTNGFDLQHFAGAHDRQLVGMPQVTTPHPAARRIVADFDVCGRSWRDWLTRHVSGPRVRMDVTVWGGTLAFVAASFFGPEGPEMPRTTSYGMVEIRPEVRGRSSASKTLVRVHIFVRRGRGAPARVDALVRRHFIRAFLQPDAQLLNEVRYAPNRLIEADRVMIDYLRWLAPVSHGHLTPEDSP